jgi:hypothetical protein
MLVASTKMLKGNTMFFEGIPCLSTFECNVRAITITRATYKVKCKAVPGLPLDPMSWPWCCWGSAIEATGLKSPLKLEPNAEVALFSPENGPVPYAKARA